jgi:CubicO group peptidase (beta-lactamase class C family)
VVEKVSRQPLDVFLRQNVFMPLRMVDTDFFVPQAKFSRYMPAYSMNENGMLVPLIRPGWDLLQGYRTPSFVSGGAGIVSTALDYARFAQMLLNGGELDGQRVLKAESVDAMWRNVLPPSLLPINMNGWTSDPNTGWALGWTVSTTEPTLNVDWSTKTGGDRTGTIGWGGGAMTNWLVSSFERRLCVCASRLFRSNCGAS